MRNLTIIFLLIAITVWNTNGQSSLENGSDSEILSLRIESMNFIKNNEYYNPVIEGYTMPGFFFQPELVYSPTSKITLRGGAYLLKYHGLEKFSQIKPVLSTTLYLTKTTTLTIGTLSGSEKHQLFDPHFNSERMYNAYNENGFQLTSRTNHLFNDAWLNWENFIVKGDSSREIFTFGESFKYTSSPVAEILHFEFPVQFQLKHFGGQISNYSEHVETHFNLATGVRMNIDLADKRFGQAGIEYLQFINKLFAGQTASGITYGYASWLRLHYTYKAVYIGAAYWKGHNFDAPNGNDIYGSISDYQPGVVIPNRRIISNFFYITLLPESYLELFFGVDTYYDTDLKRLDNSMTLHLNFDKLIRIAVLRH